LLHGVIIITIIIYYPFCILHSTHKHTHSKEYGSHWPSTSYSQFCQELL